MQNEFELQPGTHFSPLNLLEKSENFLSVHRVKLKGEEEKKKTFKNYWMTLSYEEL